ncbi:MAG: hypothetical protein NZZ41_04625 [Candidatus Dojkabacteria bacterium]|nr:hypothetical protein [Candidatus Dojkabacteria bacterium]
MIDINPHFFEKNPFFMSFDQSLYINYYVSCIQSLHKIYDFYKSCFKQNTLFEKCHYEPTIFSKLHEQNNFTQNLEKENASEFDYKKEAKQFIEELQKENKMLLNWQYIAFEVFYVIAEIKKVTKYLEPSILNTLAKNSFSIIFLLEKIPLNNFTVQDLHSFFVLCENIIFNELHMGLHYITFPTEYY